LNNDLIQSPDCNTLTIFSTEFLAIIALADSYINPYAHESDLTAKIVDTPKRDMKL